MIGFVTACGSAPADIEGASAPSGDEISMGPVERGRSIAEAKACRGCHEDAGGPALSGRSTRRGRMRIFGPNLTPDPATGVGDWGDEQLERAIRDGIDDEGQTLCGMPRFDGLSGEEMRALIAYLRSLPPVQHEVPETECPGS
jgi:hypothetical protein